MYGFDRTEGGIPPLVELLESTDSKVQRAAAGALRTLAFKNEANKNQVKTPRFMLEYAITWQAAGVWLGDLWQCYGQ